MERWERRAAPNAVYASTATAPHGKDGMDLSTPGTPQVFACPVCGEPLERADRSYACAHGHGFDIAREGYINLHLAQYRRSKDPGYSKEMIAGRRNFFATGHYQPLADAVAELIASYLPATDDPAVVVDAGCGEGYYLRRLRHLLAEKGQERSTVFVGMDISKHGVRVAAKRDRAGLYAAASTYRMPIISDAADVLLTHFSPVSAADFRRAVKPGGVVLVGGPGEGHLYSFKELLYETPAEHEPADLLVNEPGFEPIAVHRIRYPLHLEGPGQVANLLLMTPFYWSVDDTTRSRLADTEDLYTEVDVTISAYRRTETEEASVAAERNDRGDIEDW
ncbi:MAG: putative RNA methyltransferase [Pseudonocardiaceae bacterium]